MCGIAGFVDLDGAPADAGLARRMIDRLRHRGPDGVGVRADGPCALAHARLSIIDLEGGAQPMANEDGTVQVVFNGEIFNYLELRDDLARAGHRFATRSDTEVIVHAWEERGPDCVRDFNGQWAFALWDARRRALFLSRDRMGVRPLYWTRASRRLYFASEVKALFACPEVPRAIDPVGLDQVFTGWAPLAPRTIFENVRQLPPGCSLLLEQGELRNLRHFSVDYPPPDEAAPAASEDALAEELLALLVDATRLRLRSDVPVGAYLSGGLDSSLTTALIRRVAGAPLSTFSVTFDDPEFDESAAQRAVLDHLGLGPADHHAVRCTPEEVGRVFPSVIFHAEQPVVRTAPAPFFLLARRVRESGTKVVLTGEGADETFGGYDLFKEAKIRRFWARRPQSTLRPLLLRRLYPWLPNLRAQSDAYLRAFFHVRPEDTDSPLFSHLPRFELTQRIKLFYAPSVKQRLAAHAPYRALLDALPPAFAGWDPFCQAQYLETTGLLPGYILSAQGDRMAMAHGVEGRYPFLDHRVVAFAARLSPRLKMKVLDEKYLLKRAAAGLVPPSTTRRPKQPWRAPEAPSFFDPATGRARLPWVDDLLGDAALRASGLFHPDATARLCAKARAGGVAGFKDAMALVAILSTQLLHHQFIARAGDTPHVD